MTSSFAMDLLKNALTSKTFLVAALARIMCKGVSCVVARGWPTSLFTIKV